MATARALRLVASSPSTTQRSIVAVHRRLALLSTTTEAAGAGDPAVHSGEPPSEDYAERPPKFSGAEEATAGASDNKHPSRPTESSASTTAKERVPPFGPSGKLGSQELVDPAVGSTFTQKRHRSSSDRAPAGSDPLGDATPGDEEAAARKVREEDREYYRTRKPSPLAEVEFADTRKPLTRHTDGGAEDRAENDVPGAAMVRDTADASLARAEAMFREAASRGNPAWPHSRALAAMLARRGGEGAAGDGGSAPWGS